MTYRIGYIKLVNLIGIWEGMGTRTFELDFTKGKNKIIIFAGKNGSGKTTVLSCLHPMAHNNDERKNIILPFEEGYKEIHIYRRNDKYVIKHYYTSSVKSYISKNGKELNENGGVKTFEFIVSKELEFDKSYFRIGRIGDNILNFIDMKAAERKKFIFENFLPNVDEYLYYFKIVKEKYNDLHSNIKFLVDELSKIEDPDNLYVRVEKETNQIDQLEAKKNKLESKVMLLDEKINETLEAIGVEDISKVAKTIKKLNLIASDLEDDLESFQNNLEATINKIGDNVDSYYQKITKRDNELKNELTIKQSELKLISKNISSIKDSIKKEKSKLVRLNTINDDRESLEAELEKNKKELKKSKELLENSYAEHVEFFNNNKDITIEDIFNHKNSIDNIVTLFKDTLSTLVAFDSDKWSIYDCFNLVKKDAAVTLESEIKRISKAIENNKENVRKLNDKINVLQESAKKTNVLKLRPEDCTINTCGFIKGALETKKLMDEEYPQWVESIRLTEGQIKIHQQELNMLTLFHDEVYIPLNNIKLFLSKNKNNLLLKYHLDDCTEINFFDPFKIIRHEDFTPDMIDNLFTNIVSELRTTFINLNNLEKLESKLNEYNSRLQVIEQNDEIKDSVSVAVSEFTSELNEVQADYNTLFNEINDIQAKKLKNDKRIEFISNLLEDISNNDDKVTKLDETKAQIKTIESEYNKLIEYSENISTLQAEINDIESNLKILIKSRQSNLTSIDRYENYSETKQRLDENFRNVSLVYKALDPKNGIPVHLIGNYLEETTEIANSLLDISQKGNFRIKFVVNESEFKIPVVTGDVSTTKDDINLASQGQKALTKVSVSLALMQQRVKGGYNILALDEPDATLDDENSKHFVDMIDRQSIELNSQQVFIISHNREFESQNVDLVLFREHGLDINRESFMEGKNILFQV